MNERNFKPEVGDLVLLTRDISMGSTVKIPVYIRYIGKDGIYEVCLHLISGREERYYCTDISLSPISSNNQIGLNEMKQEILDAINSDKELEEILLDIKDLVTN